MEQTIEKKTVFYNSENNKFIQVFEPVNNQI